MPDDTDDKLDGLRQMLGPDAGNLAMVLERLTDVMALINLHAVYCRVEKGPRAGRPPLDVEQIIATLDAAKRLLQETLQGLNASGGPAGELPPAGPPG